MFFKRDPLKAKKKEIADCFFEITSWPISQIGLEPKKKDLVKLIEFSLATIDNELLDKTDAYVLAMAVAYNIVEAETKSSEFLIVCLLCVSVMLAVGGKANLSEDEIDATKHIAAKAKEKLLEHKDKLDYQLNVNLLINMALNGWNKEKEVL